MNPSRGESTLSHAASFMGMTSSQPKKHFHIWNGFIIQFFFPLWVPKLHVRVWEELGSSWNEHSQDKRSNSPAVEVVKDICSWPQTPPAAAALVQALLQGLSQALALGVAPPTFCAASALPALHFWIWHFIFKPCVPQKTCWHLISPKRCASFFYHKAFWQRCWFVIFFISFFLTWPSLLEEGVGSNLHCNKTNSLSSHFCL